MKTVILSFFTCVVLVFSTSAQKKGYWQQHVDYKMEIDMDVSNYRYQGKQKLKYTNNSLDTLTKVYYHLYFNAFQPGSEMDTRLQNIYDPDKRMVENIGTVEAPIFKSRIAILRPDEIGYIKVKSVSQKQNTLAFTVDGTVLEVLLSKPLYPGRKTVIEMDFEGQVPLQIRRSGRNSKEGVALSMSQWYPKLAEYDFEGWHLDSYIAREFHGVWGDFDVKIHIDKNYVVGGTGYLKNPQRVGHGYHDPEKKLKLPEGEKITWHFNAPNVHDFTWAADPNFKHDVLQTKSGTTLHFLYKKNLEEKYLENWEKLQPKTEALLDYYNKHIGAYPYKQYSVIQGGDGGMEYGMCTLITGKRSYGSLVGVVAHELAHSWFQFVLASNETRNPWMDEGFTTYISNYAENVVLEQKNENPQRASYDSYFNLLSYKVEEPQTTFGDHFKYNFAYSISSYNKGAIFLSQLEYIIGKEAVEKTLQKYYQDFKFKHPTPNDIKRTAERVSGLSLGWYLNFWTQSTHTIDYAVAVENENNISLSRIGRMPMPIDLKVVYQDGTEEAFYIPLKMMRGGKKTNATRLKSWSWTANTYSFETKSPIRSVEIDPSMKMADVDRKNNAFPAEEQLN